MVVMEEAVVEGAAASEDVNLVELMNARARSYGMLARLFREEVDLADAARAAEDALSPGHGQCGRR